MSSVWRRRVVRVEGREAGPRLDDAPLLGDEDPAARGEDDGGRRSSGRSTTVSSTKPVGHACGGATRAIADRSATRPRRGATASAARPLRGQRAAQDADGSTAVAGPARAMAASRQRPRRGEVATLSSARRRRRSPCLARPPAGTETGVCRHRCTLRPGGRRSASATRPRLAEDRVDGLDEPVRVGRREDERRLDLHHVVERAVGAEQDAALRGAVRRARGASVGVRLAGLAVADELDPDEEARAADVADRLVAVGELAEAGERAAPR